MIEATAVSVGVLGNIRTRCHAMREVLTVIERLACTDITVMLVGETGSGKSLLARLMHARSGRGQSPLVVLDCGAIPSNLAGNELLGLQRDGATNAESTHLGAFERAQGGTLLIDDGGELPLDLQARLLRILENRSVRRLGCDQDRTLDVRVLATTSRELEPEVKCGRFRQDLYFRLAAAVVRVPPLRDRREDIPLLVDDLLIDLGHPGLSVPAETIELLQARAWPGNVRELKNALACALAVGDGTHLQPHDLRFLPPAIVGSPLGTASLAGISLEQLEQTAIRHTLARSNGNKVQAARSLGIAVSTLYEKLKRYAIE